MARTEQLHPYRGYVIDVGVKYSPQDNLFFGYIRIHKDHATIHRVERCEPAANEDLAATHALTKGEDYIDGLLGPVADTGT